MSQPRLNVGRARKLRREATAEEVTMWKWLRNRAVMDLKWRRQHPVGGYILDFACVEARVAVELDGAGHPANASYDVMRDAELADLGWTVLRFGNDDVVLRLHAVLETIVRAVRPREDLPSP